MQLTENFERPADRKYLERTMGLEEEESKEDVEPKEPGIEGIELKEVPDVPEEEGEEPNGFDPEDPEGAGPREETFEEAPPMPVGFQLLRHVDSPEREEPDEA